MITIPYAYKRKTYLNFFVLLSLRFKLVDLFNFIYLNKLIFLNCFNIFFIALSQSLFEPTQSSDLDVNCLIFNKK